MRRIQIEEVKFVTKDSGGFRVHGIDDKSVEVQVPLIDVRAAVTPPQADRPGYYLGARCEVRARMKAVNTR